MEKYESGQECDLGSDRKGKAEPPSFLSRSALYAPLSVIGRDGATSSSVRKSLQEQALYDFYADRSAHFHAVNDRLDGKNTSGRPLTADEIASRLRLRTLTLVGGGYGTAPRQSSKQPPTAKRTISSRKRKRRGTDKTTQQSLDPAVMRQQALFLRHLNEQWNEYARKVLQINDSGDRSSDEMLSFSSACWRERMEWIGAAVRVNRCKQHIGWVGRTGVLCGQTTCTWRVAWMEQERKKLDERERDSVTGTWKKTLLIPKLGTSLIALLPVLPSQQEEGTDEPAVTPKPLCFVLEEPE